MAKQAAEAPRPISPAGWAHIASEGRWTIRPHLSVLNRKISEAAIKRFQGQKTLMIVSAPPRMGKSQFCSEYLPGWWLGMFPDDQVIVTAYEETFADEWGRKAQKAFEQYAPTVFHRELDPSATAASRWGVKGRLGMMRTMGAMGSLIGKGAHLLIVDDPIKNFQEALSETSRESLWNWWLSTVRTRLEPGAVVIIIMQRWHEDDIVGRLIAAMEEGNGEAWDVIKFPALAEENDVLGRQVGEPLWPERMGKAELEAIRKASPYWFAAQYQQSPRPKGGNIFQRDWFQKCKASEVPHNCDRCRFWDKAGTEDGGDWSASVRMARSKDGRYFVENVTRDRLSSYGRDQKIIAVSAEDAHRFRGVRIRADQDPAQAGKSDAEHFRKMLDRYDVKTKVISGDKEVNARPFASAVEGGNVWIVEAPWNEAYLNELEAFPKGKYDDMVDASSGSYNELAHMDQTLRVGPNPTAGYNGRRAS